MKNRKPVYIGSACILWGMRANWLRGGGQPALCLENTLLLMGNGIIAKEKPVFATIYPLPPRK